MIQLAALRPNRKLLKLGYDGGLAGIEAGSRASRSRFTPRLLTARAIDGSAARGDPLYEALVQLLRTVFLADYFVNEAFRRELLRVLNRGESANALKRAIYAGRVASYQAKQPDEMQAVADALSLLANLVMAWNTMKMQGILDRWNARRSTAVPPELIGRIAPTRTEGINLRGVFSFPIEQYAEQLLPSLSAAKSAPAAAS